MKAAFGLRAAEPSPAFPESDVFAFDAALVDFFAGAFSELVAELFDAAAFAAGFFVPASSAAALVAGFLAGAFAAVSFAAALLAVAMLDSPVDACFAFESACPGKAAQAIFT
jgi:hypothetical protein